MPAKGCTAHTHTHTHTHTKANAKVLAATKQHLCTTQVLGVGNDKSYRGKTSSPSQIKDVGTQIPT